MENEQLLKILRTVNANSDLNENNIIEKIKEKLEKKDLDTYEEWEDSLFNINYTFDDQSTLLHIAARNDLVNIAELLIKKGINVDATDQDGHTPLHCAIHNEHKEIVELLLNTGANVDAAGQDGRTLTPLHYATLNGHEEIVELLLNKGANVDSVGCAGGTVLHHAVSAENCKTEIVKKLIEKEANVDIADEYGRTPLCWAIRNGYSEAVRILLENKADPLLEHKSFNTLKLYNAPICLDHFFQSDPIFKMNMLINTSTHI